MSKVAHGRVLVNQNGAESYRGQSMWTVVLRGQSFHRGQSVVLIVVVSHRGQSFFVVSRSLWSSWSVIFSCSVSRLNSCGQSSSSVVFRGQSYFLVTQRSSCSSLSVVVVSRSS